MKTYLQRIVHDSLRALPALTSDRAGEIIAIEAAPMPEYTDSSPAARVRSKAQALDNHSAHIESVSTPGHQPLSFVSTEITRENLVIPVASNTTTNTVIAQADSASLAKPITDNILTTQNNSSAPNKPAIEKEVIQAGRTLSNSTSEVLQQSVISAAQKPTENFVRATSATPLLKEHDVEHMQTQQQVARPQPRESEEKLYEEGLTAAAGVSVAAKNIGKENAEIAAAPVVTTRAIAQTPPTAMMHTVVQRPEPAAPQLHIGEVRITVQDEPRKNAKPKRKRNTESESRLLIRSL